MYPKDISECNTGAHLASPLPHLSSLFLLAGGTGKPIKLPMLLSLWAQTNSPAMAEGQNTALLKGLGFFSQRSFLAKCLHLIQSHFELRVQLWPWAGIFELHLFTCEGGPWPELQSLPWGPSLPMPASSVGSLPQGGGTVHSDQVSTATSSSSELWIISRTLNVV